MNHCGTSLFTHELFQHGCGQDETARLRGCFFFVFFLLFSRRCSSVGRLSAPLRRHIPERRVRKARDFFSELVKRLKSPDIQKSSSGSAVVPAPSSNVLRTPPNRCAFSTFRSARLSSSRLRQNFAHLPACTNCE